jgi:predicted RNA-binding protein YlxR (DUF448 family)
MIQVEGPGVKRVIERLCVACRTLKPRNSLIRLVRLPDGSVALDNSVRMHGRGAYVCCKRDCVELAAKRGGLARALKKPVPPELMKDVIALVQEMN